MVYRCSECEDRGWVAFEGGQGVYRCKCQDTFRLDLEKAVKRVITNVIDLRNRVSLLEADIKRRGSG